MARFSSHTIFGFTLPALIGFLSFIWLRRKKKVSSQPHPNEPGRIATSSDVRTSDGVRENTSTVIAVEPSNHIPTGENERPVASMQLKGSQSGSDAKECCPPCQTNVDKTVAGPISERTDDVPKTDVAAEDGGRPSADAARGDSADREDCSTVWVPDIEDGVSSLRLGTATDASLKVARSDSENPCKPLVCQVGISPLGISEPECIKEKSVVGEQQARSGFDEKNAADVSPPSGFDVSRLQNGVGSLDITFDNPVVDSLAGESGENNAVLEVNEASCKPGSDTTKGTLDVATDDVKDSTLLENDTRGPVLSTSSGDDATDSPSYSNYSDVHSEGSSDSGKGGSDIQGSVDALQTAVADDARSVYEFELPQQLCGRLIGKYGKNVNYIKNCSNATIFIKRHPFNQCMKLCVVEGLQSEVTNALELVRRKFPLNQFPSVSLEQFNVPLTCGIPLPESLQLHLPEGVSCDVILSSMVTAGHFFLQQPTHPSYPSLSRLDQYMVNCYAHMNTPTLPKPVEMGIICAAPMCEGWFRVQVICVHEETEECDVKFVDYGGFSRLPLNSLRQIRSDFMTLPFQGVECYLGHVKSVDEGGTWSPEACTLFEELAQGQILQALIVGYADDGVPYVHLYRIQGVSTIFINRELVNRGYATWTDHQQ